jgi:hypothetical protein
MTEPNDLLTDGQLARILLDLLDHPGPVSRQRDAITGDVLVTFSTGLSYTVRPDGERYNVRRSADGKT